MNKMIDRRSLLQATGALVVTFGLTSSGAGAQSAAVAKTVSPDRVDGFLAIGTDANPHPLQQAFIEEQAVQCGYCINGMIMQSATLLARNPKPNEQQVKAELANNLCRCGTHLRIVRAVMRAAGG